MKNFMIGYLIPLIIAICFLLKLQSFPQLNQILFDKQSQFDSKDSNYIRNFSDSPAAYQDWFLKSGINSDVIFLLGSSELMVDNEATPYHFINEHFSIKLNAVGHAGNQCFSMYSQLLANEERLKNAPIIIIISPFWFQSNYANGTTPNLFLEYSTDKFLNKIIRNDSIEEFKKYESQRVSDYCNTFKSPPLSFQIFKMMSLSSENILKKFFYSPVIVVSQILLNSELVITNGENDFFNRTNDFARKPIEQDSVYINWDSLFSESKNRVLKKSTHNKWAVNNDYYVKYVNGICRTLEMVEKKDNVELRDFEMLLKLVHDKKVNASFLILPMNPYVYKNLGDLTPLVDSLDKQIKDKNFKCLNLWVTDTAKFDKGILTDIMHLSEYGWYKVDKWIMETYNLNTYKND